MTNRKPKAMPATVNDDDDDDDDDEPAVGRITPSSPLEAPQMVAASAALTLAQTKRLVLGLRRLDNVVDGLGCPIDPGISIAVAMLVKLGINTSQSCEGHDGWATGGPYIDVSAPGYRTMKAAYQKAVDSDHAERLREWIGTRNGNITLSPWLSEQLRYDGGEHIEALFNSPPRYNSSGYANGSKTNPGPWEFKAALSSAIERIDLAEQTQP